MKAQRKTITLTENNAMAIKVLAVKRRKSETDIINELINEQIKDIVDITITKSEKKA